MKRLPISIFLLFLFFFLALLAVSQEVPKQEPGYLGCVLIGLTDNDRQVLASKGLQAATKVGTVLPNTPAARTGLHTNDIILAFQGSDSIKDPNDLVAKIRASGSGTIATLSILRDRRKKAFEVR